MPIHGYPGNVITANPTAPTSSVATGVWTTEQQLKAVAAGNWPFTIPTQQISLSARFNIADSAYLSRTPAVAGNRKTWTWSGWVKRSNVSSVSGIFSALDNSTGTTDVGTAIRFLSTTIDIFDFTNGVYNFQLETTQVFRDPSAWYHIVVAFDTTQATASNRIKLYVNGVQVTTFTTATYPNQNTDWKINSTVAHGIGGLFVDGSPTQYFAGYMAEINFIDGQALTPASFGRNNIDTGVWEPIAYTGTYGTNGFELPFNLDVTNFSADYLVVAGGGGGGYDQGGGGGAGGYRDFSSQSLAINTAYTVTVGAGGSAGTSDRGGSGSNSVFSTNTSAGGGGGGGDVTRAGISGGSGGGTGGNPSASTGGSGNTPSTSPSQGNNGGTSTSPTPSSGAGGGGASAVGGVNSSGNGGNGGAGTASSITGSSVTRAGGGGGGARTTGETSGDGGSGGGGKGGYEGVASVAGTANTGGGGGGGYGLTSPSRNGAAGGSGVVIIKIPNYLTATFSGGVTSSLSTAVSGFKIYTVTATSTTSETVTFS